jgi:hypothetical protein
MAKSTPAQTFARIYALWVHKGTSPGDRASAKDKIDRWLKKHNKTFDDIPAILAQAEVDNATSGPPPPPPDPRDAGPAQSVDPGYTVLDLIRQRVELYLVFSSPHEYVAYTLWATYAHVYEFYQHAPRLVITSPTSGCGKSRGLRVLDRLVARPKMSDNFTTATLYDSANDRRTLLVDEADNLDFDTRGSLRAVFNSGYEKGGMFPRGVGKQRREYRTFVPLAMASIGVLTPPGTLPPPLMRRSIILVMQKRRPKRRFVTGNTPDLDALYRHLTSIWAPGVILSPDPELPDELLRADPSVVDNWRPLISVADACSPAWGTLAREAAVFFAQSGRHEDPIVVLLRDIRTVFDVLGVDRITIKALVTALHEMEDGRWSEFCGVQRNRTPHKLRESELRAMLRPLGIVTHSVWPGKGKPGDHSGKGYSRADFEAAWRAYCGEAEEAETGKPAKVLPLRPPGSA